MWRVMTSDVLELGRIQGLDHLRRIHCITGGGALLELAPWVEGRCNVNPLIHIALQEPWLLQLLLPHDKKSYQQKITS
jgi:hypothetical protein